MSAIGTLALMAALGAGETVCPDISADPAALLPPDTTVVVGVDVDAFARTTTGQSVLPALRADLQLAEALEIFDDCSISLERTYALTLGRDAGDGRLAVVQARGIGSAPTLTCLAAELRARSDGADPWQQHAAGSASGRCHPSLELADGSRAWIVNDYTLVWARGSFVDSTRARLDGDAPLELPTGLQAELARLDRSGHIWLAAKLDDDDRRTLPGAWASSVQSLTAAIDMSEGLRAVVSLSAPDIGTTASLRELVLANFADLADRLDEYGVEHRLRERARVGIVAGVVAAELVLDERELGDIRRHVGERIRGRGPL